MQELPDYFCAPALYSFFFGRQQTVFLSQWSRWRNHHMTAASSGLELGQEYPPPGEADDIALVVSALRGQFEHDFPPGCPGPIRRAQHPKAHGCARAVSTVLGGLTAELRQGLFRTPCSHDAWVRFSSSSPLMTPDTKRDAQAQDFVLANSDALFVRNAKDYAAFARALAGGKLLSFFFGLNPLRCRLREMSNMLTAVGKRISSPLQARYWSQTPYRLGAVAVKYSARPASDTQDPAPDAPGPDFLKEALTATLLREEVVFDFLVQTQADPVRMPAEDPTVAWDERVSPFRRGATLRFPVQECDTPERHLFAENLSFTPWHSLTEHRPLGSTNRIRRQVYATISGIRRARNGVLAEEPAAEAQNAL